MDKKPIHILMLAENSLLFTCTRQDFQDIHQKAIYDVCRGQDIKWDVVYLVARRHGVAPLVYVNLLKCLDNNMVDIPQGYLDLLWCNTHLNKSIAERNSQKLAEVISFFNRKSIAIMIAKGAALSVLVYEQPWCTFSHDIDLILKPRETNLPWQEKEEIAAFLKSCGTKQFSNHLLFEYEYFEHHDVVMNGILPIDFQRIWDDAVKIKFREQDIFVMSPEDMLISVCINSCRNRYFRLKSLCDIAESINKLKDLDWGVFAEKAKAYDCSIIVYTALLVTQMTLGCKLPKGFLNRLAVNPIRSAIIYRLARYLGQCMPLYSLYPSGINMFGRRVSLALTLTYASYRPYQIRRKFGTLFRSVA